MYSKELSIIIPTKNIPELLERCLNSIPNTEGVEIIIVDDNSCPEIVDFNNYPGSDRNDVKIIYNHDKLGAGHARNIGLEYADGNWVMFVDSDDFLLPNSFKNIIGQLNSEEDIIYSLPESVYSDTLTKSERNNTHKQGYDKYSKSKVQLERWLRFGNTEPWCKIIRHSLIKNNKIKFDETVVSNDYLFAVKCGFFAQSIKFQEETYYCLTERRGSLSNNLFSNEEKTRSRFFAYLNVQTFFNENNIPLYPLYYLKRQVNRIKPKYVNLINECFKEAGIGNLEIFLKTYLSYVNSIKHKFGLFY